MRLAVGDEPSLREERRVMLRVEVADRLHHKAPNATRRDAVAVAAARAKQAMEERGMGTPIMRWLSRAEAPRSCAGGPA
jgi:hypothetical protein